MKSYLLKWYKYFATKKEEEKKLRDFKVQAEIQIQENKHILYTSKD